MYLEGTASAGLLDLSGTFVADIIAFILMIVVLARWVYPRVVSAAEARQRAVEEQLAAAARANEEAQAYLAEARRASEQARAQAQEIIAQAGRSGEQLREELRARGEEDARRIVERAYRDIEAARKAAVDAVRAQVADLVVLATQKVLGKAISPADHQDLIDQAMQEVSIGRRNR